MADPDQSKLIKCMKANALTLSTVGAVVSGGFMGAILKSNKSSWTERERMYVQFPGELFLKMLKCLIVPLLVSSIVSAIGGLDLSLSKKVGFRSIAYYCATTSFAVIEGIILVCTIRPGVGHESARGHDVGNFSKTTLTTDTLMDLTRNMFPDNIMRATMYQYQTKLVPDPSKPIGEWKMEGNWVVGSNVLGLVFFSITMGIAIACKGKAGKPLLTVFDSLGEVIMMITTWVIWISPFGIFFLVAEKIIEMESLSDTIGQLGLYFITVLLGLFIHGFILLPAMYTFFVREWPFRFTANMGQAIATAFGTASSNASLPVSMQCLEEKNHIDPRISRFVMPIGATINMDGTALYEAVAAIFIAQVRGRDLGMGDILAISVAATLAAIGAAGIPQAGLVTMVMVLDTVGLPSDDVTLIIAVDWLHYHSVSLPGTDSERQLTS
uniref:Amino acid transporter n=2 Tax=Cacopsylla melanoneura TaxID=428564 RepID=A0A8D8WDE3_9HEMI